MSSVCFLNGRWQPLAEATVPVLDRGFIFGDGVYEVIPVDTVAVDGAPVRAPFGATPHFARLARSLARVRIDNPYREHEWLALLAQLIERHPWPRQLVYLQVTRGVAKRDHAFPAGVAPTVFAMASEWPPVPREQIERGIAVVTHTDERWLHGDIKSTSLLANVLMKQFAVDHGAAETVMLRDGHLTEGSSTNVFVVHGDTIVAPAKSNLMLPGITYDAVLAIAQARGARIELRPVPAAELRLADEVWLSSSGREVLPIVSIDGAAVGRGVPGPMHARMLAWFQDAKCDDARRWQAQRAALQMAPATASDVHA